MHWWFHLCKTNWTLKLVPGGNNDDDEDDYENNDKYEDGEDDDGHSSLFLVEIMMMREFKIIDNTFKHKVTNLKKTTMRIP